jgi:hypothetical protein
VRRRTSHKIFISPLEYPAKKEAKLAAKAPKVVATTPEGEKNTKEKAAKEEVCEHDAKGTEKSCLFKLHT